MRMGSLERNRKRRGSTMLESALIFSTFLFMMIGVLDFGQFLYIHQSLVERARNAVRWGSVQTWNSTVHDQIQNLVLYNQTTAQSSGAGVFGLTASMINVEYIDDTGTVCAAPAVGCGHEVRITIHDYPYQMFSPYIAGTHMGPNIVASMPNEVAD
jgi:Flp pilus assembly protein TadG